MTYRICKKCGFKVVANSETDLIVHLDKAHDMTVAPNQVEEEFDI